MADTSQSEADPPIANGNATEEEEERLKQRPADIDADVREMERRKRVELIMSSKLFREELERILDAQLREGGGASLLQQISDMMGVPASRVHAGTFKNSNCVLPINDIRGMEGMGYAKGEKILRCKLAALYRLMDLYGWTQGIDNQVTARLNADEEVFLTAPRGLLCHEVTASSLTKVDMQGAIVDNGTTNFPVNVAGFMLHSWVHAARPDIRCIVQVRAPSVLAIAALRGGVLPLTREAALLGDVSCHHLAAGVLDPEEREKLIRSLGPHSKVLLLQGGGGGALCCGATAEEAWLHARCLAAAADAQTRLAHVPADQLILLGDEARKQIFDSARRPPSDAGPKWRVGGEEFEALMRMLDNAGFRTGYIYRQPLIKGEVPRPRNDIEVPPAVSSLGYLLEEEELYRQGLWKKMEGGRKAGDRTRWLNSPNVYQKVEVLETGTSDPKKITKWVDSNADEWVSDGSPAHTQGTPVRIDGALQFVPKNTNPKEFKQLQQQIKDYRRADKISAGPQSHILEGVTWDEASKMQDASATQTGDHVVLMGAASKGIIQRGHQHNAAVYKTPYARNPFDAVTDDDIDEYKRTIERKARGEYDTDYSESEALSGAQIMSPSEAEDSHTEGRILRIETKQAPRPSQPEVVLSDVSTDFLSGERAAAHNNSHKDSPRSTYPTNNAPSVESFIQDTKDTSIDLQLNTQASASILPVSVSADSFRFYNHAEFDRVGSVPNEKPGTNALCDVFVLQSEKIDVNSFKTTPLDKVNFEYESEMFLDSSFLRNEAHNVTVVNKCDMSLSSESCTTKQGHVPALNEDSKLVRKSLLFSPNNNTRNNSVIGDSAVSTMDCLNFKNTRSIPEFKSTSLIRALSTDIAEDHGYYTLKMPGFYKTRSQVDITNPFPDDVATFSKCSQRRIHSADGHRSFSSQKQLSADSLFGSDNFYFPLYQSAGSTSWSNSRSGLYRTRSHAGCLSSYVKYPNPKHFHIPSSGSSVSLFPFFSRSASLHCIRNIRSSSPELYYENPFKHQLYSASSPVIDTYCSNSCKETGSSDFIYTDSEQYSTTPLPYTEDIDYKLYSLKGDESTIASPSRTRADIAKKEFLENFEAKKTNSTSSMKETENDNAITLSEEDCYFDDTASLEVSADGEYCNFSDDFDSTNTSDSDYDSPVRELIGKDIWNYSMPMSLYMDPPSELQVEQEADDPLARSPSRRRNFAKLTSLEPILEETKSSVGDDSTSSSTENKNTSNNYISEVQNLDMAHLSNSTTNHIIDPQLSDLKNNFEPIEEENYQDILEGDGIIDNMSESKNIMFCISAMNEELIHVNMTNNLHADILENKKSQSIQKSLEILVDCPENVEMDSSVTDGIVIRIAQELQVSMDSMRKKLRKDQKHLELKSLDNNNTQEGIGDAEEFEKNDVREETANAHFNYIGDPSSREKVNIKSAFTKCLNPIEISNVQQNVTLAYFTAGNGDCIGNPSCDSPEGAGDSTTCILENVPENHEEYLCIVDALHDDLNFSQALDIQDIVVECTCSEKLPDNDQVSSSASTPPNKNAVPESILENLLSNMFDEALVNSSVTPNTGNVVKILDSFDSTSEFECLEAISDLVESLSTIIQNVCKEYIQKVNIDNAQARRAQAVNTVSAFSVVNENVDQKLPGTIETVCNEFILQMEGGEESGDRIATGKTASFIEMEENLTQESRSDIENVCKEFIQLTITDTVPSAHIEDANLNISHSIIDTSPLTVQETLSDTIETVCKEYIQYMKGYDFDMNGKKVLSGKTESFIEMEESDGLENGSSNIETLCREFIQHVSTSSDLNNKTNNTPTSVQSKEASDQESASNEESFFSFVTGTSDTFIESDFSETSNSQVTLASDLNIIDPYRFITHRNKNITTKALYEYDDECHRSYGILDCRVSQANSPQLCENHVSLLNNAFISDEQIVKLIHPTTDEDKNVKSFNDAFLLEESNEELEQSGDRYDERMSSFNYTTDESIGILNDLKDSSLHDSLSVLNGVKRRNHFSTPKPKRVDTKYDLDESGASISSMTQDCHKGGIKYWLTFDKDSKNPSDCSKKIVHRQRVFFTGVDKMPSFFTLEDRSGTEIRHINFEKYVGSSEDSSVAKSQTPNVSGDTCPDLTPQANQTDASVLVYVDKRSSFTLCTTSESSDDVGKIPSTENTKSKCIQFYDIASAGVTPISSQEDLEDAVMKRGFLYRTRLGMNNMTLKNVRATNMRSKRMKNFTWPPYEDTLLYRILSTFRMSESFELSDVELESKD